MARVNGVSVSIQVADAEHVYATMELHSITITQPLQDQPWGHRSFGVTEPSGLPLVFFQVME